METKQTNQIAKIAGDIETLIEHSSILNKGYNLLTGKRLTETNYLELSINLLRTDLLNVQFESEMDGEEFLVLDDVAFTLEGVLRDKREVYEYSVIAGNIVTHHETDRKGNLIGILEWALEQLHGNIEMEVM